MNCLSINIRGLVGGAKANWVKELRLVNKVGVIALQETKVENVVKSGLVGFWGNKNFDFAFVASVGLSGGLACLWDPKILKVDSVVKNRSFILLRGSMVGSGTPINLVNIYAPQSVVAKRQLWYELSDLIDPSVGQWVLVGDFNAVRSQEERKHSKFKMVCAENFNKFIFENGLLEFPMNGRKL
ncbi:uncharacterized protein LOC110920241 [Helianthus annuus]|uniref:uncharacterized protein LOC110920241 n=1 Tax=Helianthus annuus TaxID=4232 RepID=UPI000B901A5D|nr:uncharacterized protein LOC110920241 [Helianthus annuus]